MGKALGHIGARGSVPADALATIAMALFQGLLRQRRIDPASVPDELLGQAMQWLFAGIAAGDTAGAPGPGPTDDTAAADDPAAADRPEETR